MRARFYPYGFLVENVPEDKKRDVDYVLSLLDREKNVGPHHKRHFLRPPIEAGRGKGYVEPWIAYGNDYIAAQELTIAPGAA